MDHFRGGRPGESNGFQYLLLSGSADAAAMAFAGGVIHPTAAYWTAFGSQCHSDALDNINFEVRKSPQLEANVLPLIRQAT
jgi:hypothetical protein